MINPRVPSSTSSVREQLTSELSDVQRELERLKHIAGVMEVQAIASEGLMLWEEVLAKLQGMLDELHNKLRDVRERAERAGLRL